MCRRTDVDHPRLGVGLQERGQEGREMKVCEDVDPEL